MRKLGIFTWNFSNVYSHLCEVQVHVREMLKKLLCVLGIMVDTIATRCKIFMKLSTLSSITQWENLEAGDWKWKGAKECESLYVKEKRFTPARAKGRERERKSFRGELSQWLLFLLRQLWTELSVDIRSYREGRKKLAVFLRQGLSLVATFVLSLVLLVAVTDTMVGRLSAKNGLSCNTICAVVDKSLKMR